MINGGDIFVKRDSTGWMIKLVAFGAREHCSYLEFLIKEILLLRVLIF